VSARAGLAGAPVFGTLVVAAPQIDAAWLTAARATAPRQGEAAATRLPGVLLVRYVGASTEAARQHFTAVWERLREPVLGVAAARPRIWRT
jgi:urease accessory protein